MKLRGQLTSVGLILAFITLVIAVGLLPAVTEVITIGQSVNSTNSTLVRTILGLTPTVFVLGTLLSVVAYVIVTRQQ